MSTLREITANIRNTVYGAISSSDNLLSDEQIAYWFNLERATILTQDITAGKTIAEIYKQTISCLPLECLVIEDFELGIKVGGEVLRTPKLPTPISYNFPLSGMTEAFTYVGLIDEVTTIEMVTPAMANLKKHRKYSGNHRYAYYKDNYIYIVNADGLERITVRGAFEDPRDVGSYITCDGTVCFGLDSPYPISLHHESIISAKVIELRIKPYMLLRDTVNDSRENDITNKTNSA